MKPNYEVQTVGFPCILDTILLVMNLHNINKVIHFPLIDKKSIVSDSVNSGIWKVKSLK